MKKDQVDPVPSTHFKGRSEFHLGHDTESILFRTGL